MKLKYYLRGIGIGVIIASLVMGIALGGRNKQLSDSEIRERALELGMVDGDTGTLTEYASAASDASTASNIVVEEIDDNDAELMASADSSVAVGESTQQATSDSTEDTDKAVAGKSTSDKALEENSNAAAESTAWQDTTAAEETTAQATTETSTLTTIAASEVATAPTPEAVDTITTPDGEQLPVTEDENTGTLYVTVTIPGGIGSDTVCSILQKAGLIDSASSFNRFLIDKGLDRYIRSGSKRIPEGATYDEIAEIICRK
ncbi:MAG: endolytic transglycosylase MltG [Butyrivibrio sp.]|nr:endolytic transglycosylase MltG [Butyrivibrio sp.]